MRNKIFVLCAILVPVLFVLVIAMRTEKYKNFLPTIKASKESRSKPTVKDYRSKPTVKELEIYKAQALFALDMQKKRLYKMIPAAADNVLKILGKDRLNAYISGTPKIIPLPKGIDYDITPEELFSLIAAQKVGDKYYVKFDTSKLKESSVEKDHEHGEQEEYNIFEILDLFLISLALFTNGLDYNIDNIGYLIQLFSDNLWILDIPPFVGDYTWTQGGNGFITRNTTPYSGSWDVRVIIEDAEIGPLGDDFYGLTAIDPSIQNSWYASASVNNRERITTLPMADNLGFGRSDLSTTKFPPCPTRSGNKCGQGAYLGFRKFTDWTVFPTKCSGDRFTKLNFRFWGHRISSVSDNNTIIRDENYQVTDRNGNIGLNFDWVAYDKTTKWILVPDGTTPTRLVLYDVDIEQYTVTVTRKKDVQLIKSSNDDLEIVAACFGCDGMLYAVTNDYNGLQGIVIFKPDIAPDRTWLLREIDTISLDVNDSLVGITNVKDPYLVQLQNYPILTVLEINEDYLTQDNLTLHKVVPRDAYEGGNYGVESEASEWTELVQEGYCGGGVVAYNIGRSLSYRMRTRDEGLTFNHPSLVNFKAYLESIGLSREINLDTVEIYDNQCLASNYWKYDDGQRQAVRGSAGGYELFLRDELVRSDGKLNGWMCNTLIHELVHTRQYVQLGESQYQFGCAYSEAIYAVDSSYSNHPMEREARRYTERYKLTDDIVSRFSIPVNIPSNGRPFRYPRPRTTCEPE